jgi:hypothetical protein
MCHPHAGEARQLHIIPDAHDRLCGNHLHTFANSHDGFPVIPPGDTAPGTHTVGQCIVRMHAMIGCGRGSVHARSNLITVPLQQIDAYRYLETGAIITGMRLETQPDLVIEIHAEPVFRMRGPDYPGFKIREVFELHR